MTKISQYTVDTAVSGSDKWIGSDSQMQNITKNFTPERLAKYFNDNQVIDTGSDVRFKYVVLNVGEQRPYGSITFVPQQGDTVAFSTISSFILSKRNTAGNLVPDFLEFLDDKKIFISKTRDVNTFGYYNVLSVVEYEPEPDFYLVTIEFIDGNGGLTKDVDFVFEFVSNTVLLDYDFQAPLVQSGNDVSINQSTTTSDGYLSSDDWNTFNNKQDALSLTTDGDNGPATLVDDVLNVPEYTIGGLGGVPYIGATQDVDLGVNQLKADSLAVDTATTSPAATGELVWNQLDGTFDAGMLNDVTLQIGQETYFYGKASEAISNGQAVMFGGVQGSHLLLLKADRTVLNANPHYFMGIATQDFAINEFGYVTVFGKVRNIDTTIYTLGTTLYYDSTNPTPGLLTGTMPAANQAKIEVAAVVRVHATQGVLMVRVDIMPILNEIQDVDTTLSKTTPVDADALLLQDSANLSIWKKLSWSNAKATLKSYFDGFYQKGSGTTNYVPKFTGTSTLGDSLIYSSGSAVGISDANPGGRLTIRANDGSYIVELRNSLGDSRGGLYYTSLTNSANLSLQNSIGTETVLLRSSGASFLNGGNILLGTTVDDGVNKLQVNGSAISTAWKTTGGASSQFVKGDGSLDSTTYQTALTNPITGSLTTNYLPKAIGANSLGNSLIYDNGTNVGIGTTSPTYTLDILGGAGNTARLKGSGQCTLSLNDGTNDNYIVGVSGQLRLLPSGSLALTAKSNGAILINTSTDNGVDKLQVNGGAKITETLLAGSGSLAGSALTVNQTWNTTGNPTAMLLNVTNTASGNSAKLMDLQVGGVSKFNVSKAGSIVALSDATINDVKVGRGGGNVSTNTVLGSSVLSSNTSGSRNSAIGYAALTNNTVGSYNSAIGTDSGRYIANKSTAATILNNSIMIGYRTSPLGDNQTNQIVIGHDATGLGSNTTVLGNSSTVTTAIYGNLGLGTTAPASTSILDLTSTTRGFLPPRMTEAQRDAISSPALGLMIFNTDTEEINVYIISTGWKRLIWA